MRPATFGFGFIQSPVLEQRTKRLRPWFEVLLRNNRPRHVRFVEFGKVALDGPHRNHKASALPRLAKTAGVARDHGNRPEHRLHRNQSEAFIPEGRHEQNASLPERLIDVVYAFDELDIVQSGQRFSGGCAGAPAWEPRERVLPKSGSQFDED